MKLRRVTTDDATYLLPRDVAPDLRPGAYLYGSQVRSVEPGPDAPPVPISPEEAGDKRYRLITIDGAERWVTGVAPATPRKEVTP